MSGEQRGGGGGGEPFDRSHISPIPFLMDTSPVQSGHVSPVEYERAAFDNRSSSSAAREEWDTESDMMGHFGRMTPSDMDRFLHMAIIRDDHSNSRPWNAESSMDSDEWLNRELRNTNTATTSSANLLQTTVTEHISPTNPSGNEAASSTISDSGATRGSPSSEIAAATGNVDEQLNVSLPLLSSSTPLPLIDGSNDENGNVSNNESLTPEPEPETEVDAEEHSIELEDNSQTDSTISSLHTSEFDPEAEAVIGDEAMQTPPPPLNARDDVRDENGRPRRRRAGFLDNSERAYMSPLFFSSVYGDDYDNDNDNGTNSPLPMPRFDSTNITENENNSSSNANNNSAPAKSSRTNHLQQQRISSSSTAFNENPSPLKLPSNTRLKITIKKWNVAATWKWIAGDETCGICRMPFEACCIECKTPGDECPLAIGSCKHAFHMHCIVKWTETQNTTRPQCPLCRQEWKFAAG